MTPPLSPADLLQFTGTENWYRHPLVRDVVYTDGARYLAQQAGAYWLLDEIALAQKASKIVGAEPFQTWTLEVAADQSAVLRCDDGNGRSLLETLIPWTDFPLDGIRLFFCGGTILLPSEY